MSPVRSLGGVILRRAEGSHPQPPESGLAAAGRGAAGRLPVQRRALQVVGLEQTARWVSDPDETATTPVVHPFAARGRSVAGGKTRGRQPQQCLRQQTSRTSRRSVGRGTVRAVQLAAGGGGILRERERDETGEGQSPPRGLPVGCQGWASVRSGKGRSSTSEILRVESAAR